MKFLNICKFDDSQSFYEQVEHQCVILRLFSAKSYHHLSNCGGTSLLRKCNFQPTFTFGYRSHCRNIGMVFLASMNWNGKLGMFQPFFLNFSFRRGILEIRARNFVVISPIIRTVFNGFEANDSHSKLKDNESVKKQTLSEKMLKGLNSTKTSSCKD